MNRVAFSVAFFSAMTLALPESAAQNPEFNGDPWEIRLPQGALTPSDEAQRAFRDGSVWHQTEAAQAGWRVQAHENRVCLRACTDLACAVRRLARISRPCGLGLGAWRFWLSGDALGEVRVARGSKHDRVFATQELDGLPVLGAKLQAKFRGDRLVMVGSIGGPTSSRFPPTLP